MKPSKIIVCDYDKKGEPWPIATIDIGSDGKCKITGNALDAHNALFIAAKQTGMRKLKHELTTP